MDWMLDVLKELAGKHKPQLIKAVRKNFEAFPAKYSALFDYVFQNYYDKVVLGRWYDSYHVAYSTSFCINLVRNREASPLVVPAIILHDIGYSVLTNKAKANWNASQNRIIHMQEGAGVAAKALVYVGGFDGDEISDIVGMVASHDNLSLDIQTNNPLRLALTDSDRIWVMHFISFWKDFVSETGHAENLSPSDLFQIRQPMFYKNIIPYTSLARQWRDKQFKKRLREIQSNIMQDRDTFRKYAEKHIRAELEAGRG